VSREGDVSVQMRVYYSSYHLWAAKHFVQMAAKIEDAHEGEPTFNIEHRAYVTNAILSSFAFMEAAVNEPMDLNVQTLLANMWDLTETRNRSTFHVLDKCQVALVLARKEPIPKNEQLFENANLLRKLRNELMHYKPQTLGESDSRSLDRSLVSKFPPNKLMAGAGNPSFPDHLLGKGCAQWAVTSSENYMNAFFARLGVVPNYQRVDF
jgi:hypothetical protein